MHSKSGALLFTASIRCETNSNDGAKQPNGSRRTAVQVHRQVCRHVAIEADPAPRFLHGAELSATARLLGLEKVGAVISNALNSDRADTTINLYRTEVLKFQAWKDSPNMRAIPTPKARNLYLAKCASEGRQKALPIISSALTYFCGQLTGIDKEIQTSILEAEKRITPPVRHRTKIDRDSMRKLILLGTSSSDPKITQAAALALLQFKGLLRISEARTLRCSDVSSSGDGLWTILVVKSKTDQYGSGTRVSIQLDEAEHGLLNQYASRNLPNSNVLPTLDLFTCHV
ncbi:hypothetical protein ANCCEY_01842 [Ancylostoma ceylanicum]|uniref:Uncharacterized protein n=1 Tax=Ancylostoma ceylanicum TaxID=53326 RepID=A0A0D6M4L1_9BILA|nr:hypothetical protein ANCCEY_01842 [Ancylostoma ceylanicum]